MRFGKKINLKMKIKVALIFGIQGSDGYLAELLLKNIVHM